MSAAHIHLGTVAVVENAVGAASARAGDLVLGGKGSQAGRDGGGADTLKRQEVEDDASNVRSSHGGTGESGGGGVATNVGGENGPITNV